jgi:hypothetical protein
MAWVAYDDIFQHLERHDALLRATGEPWKVQLGNCLGAAQEKLSEYYTRTDGPRGLLYNLSCILDPTKKLSLYNGNGFEPQDAKEYEAEFRQFHEDFYSHLCSEELTERPSELSLGMDLTSIAIAKRQQGMQSSPAASLLDRYLRSDLTTDFQPLEFWKVHAPFMPSLAQMAKDILAIPIAGVGVERIFSIARQICSYQRNRFDAETITQLMIVCSHDRLMVVDEPENKRNIVRLKKKVAFSKLDNNIAEAQQILEAESAEHPLINPQAIAPASMQAHSHAARKKRGRKVG